MLENMINVVDERNPQDSQLEAIALPAGKDGPLSQALRNLEELQIKLKPTSGWRAIGNLLKWPLAEPGVIKTLACINRLKTTLVVAASTDHLEGRKAVLKWLDAPSADTNLDVARSKRCAFTGIQPSLEYNLSIPISLQFAETLTHLYQKTSDQDNMPDSQGPAYIFDDDICKPVKSYDEAACHAALRGERLPDDLTLTIHKLAVVRGILHNPGFGKKLHGHSPLFARALNARSIMSNVIPAMCSPEEFPYCIWHPDTATEDTYRELALRYPNMKYQVGRACAVAGYYKLYTKLNLLPDVHIAEEARDNGNSDIFDLIMESPVQYEVMSDYNRTTNPVNPSSPAYLNGDTAVTSWLLTSKQPCRGPDEAFGEVHDRHNQMYFNITEDMNVDEDFSDLVPIPPEIAQLLYMPLPPHLPNVDKDLLILMAAYNGDINAYSRLRRPTWIRKEFNCIIRGIYNNTMFAKWWSLQSVPDRYWGDKIDAAINARFIMNNDLSRIGPGTSPFALPELIYYPRVASVSTYKELFKRQPTMKEPIAHACIIGDFQELYDSLDVEPDRGLMIEASESPNKHYLTDLERKLSEGAKMPDDSCLGARKGLPRRRMFEKGTRDLVQNLTRASIDIEFDFIYDGHDIDVSEVELFVSVSEEVKKSLKYSYGRAEIEQSYKDGP